MKGTGHGPIGPGPRLALVSWKNREIHFQAYQPQPNNFVSPSAWPVEGSGTGAPPPLESSIALFLALSLETVSAYSVRMFWAIPTVMFVYVVRKKEANLSL